MTVFSDAQTMKEREGADHAANISIIASLCWANYALAFQRVMFGVSAAMAVCAVADIVVAVLAQR